MPSHELAIGDQGIYKKQPLSLRNSQPNAWGRNKHRREVTHQEIISPSAASLQDLQSNVQRMRYVGEEEDMGDRKIWD